MFEKKLGEGTMDIERKEENLDKAAVAAQAYLTEEGRKKIWQCLLGKKEEETGK